MAFPSLVGGLSMRQDFVPSILFAALYIILICINIYRMIKRTSRTMVLHGTSVFFVERAVSFCLRAAVANRPASHQSDGLIEYMQTTLAMGILAIVVDQMNLLRCLLVNSTYPSEPLDLPPSPASAATLPKLISDSKSTSKCWLDFWRQPHDFVPSPPPSPEKEEKAWSGSLASTLFASSLTECGTVVELEDEPRRRFWFRRIHDMASVVGTAALAIGITGNAMLIPQRRSERKSHINQILRTTSTTLTLLLTLCVAGMTVWAGRNLRRVNQKAISWLLGLSMLLTIPGVYRLVVMHRTTTSYDSLEPGAYNSRGAKAVFYILHVLPELLVSGAMCLINVRPMFGTGFAGDHKWRDETAEEKEKRERKEREKAEETLWKAY